MCTYVDEEIHIKPNNCCRFFSPDIKVLEEHKYFEFSRRHLSAAEKEKDGGAGDFLYTLPTFFCFCRSEPSLPSRPGCGSISHHSGVTSIHVAALRVESTFISRLDKHSVNSVLHVPSLKAIISDISQRF